ncbi:CaiB/BaiF CoA transferase family protein [Prauserella flavalba]|uniref:CaiB/BaiF CoA transferase family protein n=1 Tax=Prauserella flavalba TaxID=1477506 RepID=UPI0036E887B3
MNAFPEPGGGSLDGIRVVELGTSVAAPMATQILGDFGAEVIKVERVGRGDDSRQWAPPDWDGQSVTFLALNRNKRSLALDLKDPRGLAVLEELIRRSDVLVQNLRPGAVAALGLTPERIAELNPRLVYCELSGFGPTGPRAGQPAYDPLLQAYSGIVSITGEDEGEPARVPVSILDMGTGMWTALAVFEALRRRDRTGAGTHVELSLLQTALMWVSMPLLAVAAGNGLPARLGSGLAGVVPYGAFPTADGHVFVSAGNDDAWARLCSALDAEHLRSADGFATNRERVQHRADVTSALSAVTRDFTTAEVLKRLTENKVPCSPVHTLDQVLADEQVRAVGALTSVEHPEVPDFQVVNLPMTFAGAYPTAPTAPPVLGADSGAVLREIGLTPAQVAELADAGVVGLADTADPDPATPTGDAT